MAIVIRWKFKHTYKGCIYMPRDENAIVGRKKTTNRVVQTMLQRKSGFFYTTNTVYIHDKMCHTFYLCCWFFLCLRIKIYHSKYVVKTPWQARGMLLDRCILPWFYLTCRRLYTSTFNYRAISCFYILWTRVLN